MPKDQMNHSLAPSLSIILSTYYRAKFLPQALASIRSQTYTDWELIVVDDGSTDVTKQLVDDLTKRMPGARFDNNIKPTRALTELAIRAWTGRAAATSISLLATMFGSLIIFRPALKL